MGRSAGGPGAEPVSEPLSRELADLREWIAGSIRPLIITVDGDAGTGKTTFARSLAERLQVRHVDGGAFYAAVAWMAFEVGADFEDEAELTAIARGVELECKSGRVYLNGFDLTGKLRSTDILQAASWLHRVQGVRRAVGAMLEPYGAESLVVCGVNVGAVFPRATVKFVLRASLESRVLWRMAEAPGESAAEVTDWLFRRDEDAGDWRWPSSILVAADSRPTAAVVDLAVGLVHGVCLRERERMRAYQAPEVILPLEVLQ